MKLKKAEKAGLTVKEYQAKIDKAYKEADKWCDIYNVAVETDKLKKALEAEEKLEEAVKDYNDHAHALALKECKESENPMHEVIRRLTYKGIKARDVKEDKDSDETTRKIEYVLKNIDISKLHRAVNGGIGADPENWLPTIEQFNYQMAYQLAKDLYESSRHKSLPPEEILTNYAISDLAKEIKLGANPCSKNQMTKTLNKVIKGMLGDEYEVKACDVKYIQSAFTKNRRTASGIALQCSRPEQMLRLCADVAHCVLLNEGYDVLVKKNKNKS